MKNKIKPFFNILFAIFLIFNPQFLSAQYEDLQKNKNITWIAEFSNVYTFSLDKKGEEQITKLIKFSGEESNFLDANRSNWIMSWIFNNVKEGHYTCYKDSDLTQPLSKKEFNNVVSNIDTVITFDPDTYEERVQIVKTDISINGLDGIKVNQVIYYDKKRKNFNTRIISIAPVRIYKKGSGNKKSISIDPLFWIKMDGKLPKKFKLKSSDINWAALVLSKANPLDLNKIKIVKTNYGFDIRNRLYEQAFNLEKKITKTYDGDINAKLTINDLNLMYTSTDTIVTFDPGTYEEQVRVIRTEITSNDISHLSLVQEWYYDKKRKRLMNRLKAICPTVPAKDDNGYFRFWKRLYYIKYD